MGIICRMATREVQARAVLPLSQPSPRRQYTVTFFLLGVAGVAGLFSCSAANLPCGAGRAPTRGRRPADGDLIPSVPEGRPPRMER